MSQQRVPRHEPLPEWIKDLFKYYIECARADEAQPIRARHGELNSRFIPWPFLTDIWYRSNPNTTIILNDDQVEFANRLSRTATGGGLLYGYPTSIGLERGRKVITPLLVWSMPYELHGRELQLRAIPQWPQLNAEYLKILGLSVEGQQEIAKSLNLDGDQDEPPIEFVVTILKRMDELGLLENLQEQIKPHQLTTPEKETGIYNCAILFAAEPPRYTAGLIRELQQMLDMDAPGWSFTSLGTMLDQSRASREGKRTVVEVVDLNEEQRQAVRRAFDSPLTAVTGPPGTGKSQIVVSMIADSYLRGRRVLFASKNHKAVDVVESRVASLATNPIVLRIGSSLGRRNLRSELTQRLASMLAMRPSSSDKQLFDELKVRYEELLDQERSHWEELNSVREANSQLPALDRIKDNYSRDYTPHEWQRLETATGLPDVVQLKEALRLTDKHLLNPDNLVRRFSRWATSSKDRTRIESIGVESVSACPAIGPYPTDEASLQAWRTWLVRALQQADAVCAIAKYREGLAAMHELRSRDEVHRQLRRARAELTDTGAKLVSIFARLAPDRLTPSHREAIGAFRSIQQRLAQDQLGGSVYARLRREEAQLFDEVSNVIPTWCVTNLSARSSLPLKANIFDLLIIDEASQCDIASALPLLYRSKRAVMIGDPQQLRHITKLSVLRDQQLQETFGLYGKKQIFAYSQNSLFDLTTSRGAIGSTILLQNHYRSHPTIIDFSNQQWYDGSLRVWTDHSRLKVPPERMFGVRWTNVEGRATRPRGGSAFIQTEVEEVVKQVRDLLAHQDFEGTVGVVTPFRAQANMIRERIVENVPHDAMHRAELIVETAHGFQGDERDIVILSPCVASNLWPSTRRFLKDGDAANLFNVGITRARSLLHVVGNHGACTRSDIVHVERFASYCAQLEMSGVSPYQTHLASDERIGPWERPLYDALVANGLKPLPQHPVNQYRLDLAIVRGDLRIDVEVDGESTHQDPRLDAERDNQLANLGWHVIRFWNHEVKNDIDYCVQKVIETLNE